MADKKVTIKIGGMEVERTYTEEMIATQKKRRAALGCPSPEGGEPDKPEPEPEPEPEKPDGGDGGEGGGEAAAVKKTRTRKKPA